MKTFGMLSLILQGLRLTYLPNPRSRVKVLRRSGQDRSRHAHSAQIKKIPTCQTLSIFHCVLPLLWQKNGPTKVKRLALYALGIATQSFRYPIRHIVDSHGTVIDLAMLGPSLG